jgi:hypothetical protein
MTKYMICIELLILYKNKINPSYLMYSFNPLQQLELVYVGLSAQMQQMWHYLDCTRTDVS